MRKSSIKKLEKSLRLGTPCEACGWPPSRPSDVQVTVIWDDGGPLEDDVTPDEDEYCESCGTPRHITIEAPESYGPPTPFDPNRSEKLREQLRVISLEDYREHGPDSHEDRS